MQTDTKKQTVHGKVFEDEDVSTVVGMVHTNDEFAQFEVQDCTEGKCGHFSLSCNGSWTYVLDNQNPRTQALDTGDKIHETFSISVKSTKGIIVSTELGIAVFGRDEDLELEAPVFKIHDDIIPGTVTEDDDVTTTIGKLYTTVENAQFTPQLGTDGIYGRFTLARDGRWVYKLDNSRIQTQALNDEDKKIEQFAVSAINSEGIRATNIVKIIVRGKDEKIPEEEIFRIL